MPGCGYGLMSSEAQFLWLEGVGGSFEATECWWWIGQHPGQHQCWTVVFGWCSWQLASSWGTWPVRSLPLRQLLPMSGVIIIACFLLPFFHIFPLTQTAFPRHCKPWFEFDASLHIYFKMYVISSITCTQSYKLDNCTWLADQYGSKISLGLNRQG